MSGWAKETKETTKETKETETFKLLPLPYAQSALEPYLSAEAVHYHYDKHHKAYVDNLNKIANKKEHEWMKSKSVEQLVAEMDEGKAFNNAAQIWNHDFFWQCMAPNTGGKPKDEISDAIDKTFGSFEKFMETFSNEAVSHFASGWAWLILTKEKKLEVISTHDAMNPLSKRDGRGTPLLTADLWEHAYYIDYRNARAEYLTKWWNVVNWDKVNRHYVEALKK